MHFCHFSKAWNYFKSLETFFKWASNSLGFTWRKSEYYQ